MTTQSRADRLLAQLETLLNTEIPNTPRISGRAIGGRVMYVPLPGKKRIRTELSKRAAQVLDLIERNHAATSAQIQATLHVNRNVVAGAIHELKQFKLVKPQPIDPEMVMVGTSGAVAQPVAVNYGRRSTDREPQPVGTVGRTKARSTARRRRQGRK